MKQFLVSNIPLVTSSLQEVICNIFLEEYLVSEQDEQNRLGDWKLFAMKKNAVSTLKAKAKGTSPR